MGHSTRGAHVLEVFEELDESGARADRPLLQEAIRRVEAGVSQGVVVAVLDRFGRSLVDSLALIDRIQAAGGTFVAVQNGLDLTTDTGRLVLRLMLSLAEYDLDRIRSNWDAARAHAIARGVHLGPKPPTGYRRLKSGRLRPDPDERSRGQRTVRPTRRRRIDHAPVSLHGSSAASEPRTGTRPGATRACAACSQTACTSARSAAHRTCAKAPTRRSPTR